MTTVFFGGTLTGDKAGSAVVVTTSLTGDLPGDFYLIGEVPLAA